MRIAIFGGSFNPIHNAHIKLAQRFVDEFCVEKVVFVPTNITPLKSKTCFVSAQHRLNMCELALKGFEKFVLSDVELKREGVSYSSDTIYYFKQIYPNDELFFIMGADMFLTLEKWHDFEYIFDNVIILTAPRNDCDYSKLVKKFEYYKRYNCKAYITKDHIEDLSSSYLRDMLSKNVDVSAYVDSKVISYIEKHKLYR